jgi:hypothetical protein
MCIPGNQRIPRGLGRCECRRRYNRCLRVNVDLRPLVRAHQADLVFFVVDCHPNIGRHYREQCLPRLDVVARFDGSLKEKRLLTVVATAPISLFAFDHTDAITLSEGKALSRTSGSNPGQLTRAGSGRTKWWPGGATFSFCIPTTPPKEIDPRFVSGAGPADADIGGRTDTKVSLQNHTKV